MKVTQEFRTRKALIGGGAITTPAVAAHVRKNAPQADLRAPQAPAATRKALIGGGAITTPAVAGHVRRKMSDAAGTRSK